jgi:hypothetical protein
MEARMLRVYLAIAVVTAVVTSVVSSFVNPQNTQANHYWIPPIHVESMHNASDNETFCAWSQDAAITYTTIQDRVKNSLWIYAPSYKWQGMASNKVNFGWYSPACNVLTPSSRAASEIEYTALSNGCGGTSCAGLDLSFYNASVGHNDYSKAYITFKTSNISGSDLPGIALYEHTINHETGHALGFRDPAYGSCVASVMHSKYYGCSTNEQFPTGGDIWNGTLIANDNVPEN